MVIIQTLEKSLSLLMRFLVPIKTRISSKFSASRNVKSEVAIKLLVHTHDPLRKCHATYITAASLSPVRSPSLLLHLVTPRFDKYYIPAVITV